MSALDTTTGELVSVPLTDTPAALTPAGSLQLMRDAAAAFREINAAVSLYVTVQGGAKHLTIEGYQAVGLLIGITAAVTHTEREGDGWKATAQVRRLSDGMVVGSADALCSKQERRWSRSDDYAICSMASTRAQSRALRGVVAPIVKLADPSIETTAAEEMPDAVVGSQVASPVSTVVPGAVAAAGTGEAKRISQAQAKQIRDRQLNAGIEDLLLLGLLYEVTGNAAPDVTPEEATGKLQRALPKFPAAKFDALLGQIGGNA